jgi:hypothetical protein
VGSNVGVKLTSSDLRILSGKSGREEFYAMPYPVGFA